jgi:putative DNA-invertase from lambdoid prophage Rac
VRWVDRLGRNYEDVCDTIRAFMLCGRGHEAYQSVPEAEATKASQRAGIEHAKGRADSPYLGRKPAFTRKQFETVRDMLSRGTSSIVEIARASGAKRPTVYRLKADPTAAEAALAAWGL